MLIIYKYPILPSKDFSIDLPKEAKFLTVQTQNGHPYVWVILDPFKKYSETKRFLIAPTGKMLPDDVIHYNYINTFQVDDGNLVFHVFEIPFKLPF